MGLSPAYDFYLSGDLLWILPTLISIISLARPHRLEPCQAALATGIVSARRAVPWCRADLDAWLSWPQQG